MIIFPIDLVFRGQMIIEMAYEIGFVIASDIGTSVTRFIQMIPLEMHLQFVLEEKFSVTLIKVTCKLCLFMPTLDMSTQLAFG